MSDRGALAVLAGFVGVRAAVPESEIAASFLDSGFVDAASDVAMESARFDPVVSPIELDPSDVADAAGEVAAVLSDDVDGIWEFELALSMAESVLSDVGKDVDEVAPVLSGIVEDSVALLLVLSSIKPVLSDVVDDIGEVAAVLSGIVEDSVALSLVLSPIEAVVSDVVDDRFPFVFVG